ncbi:HopJ type III effector protein [Balneatrix alpica]|uniref:HopJ type III effector protein n=1 Tax=Balneatrix alpica TaxID=75684 RepID=A0ABV5ZEZ4_9GAMM|nr:HopJ type III effector protein [Balneatrix alpica]
MSSLSLDAFLQNIGTDPQLDFEHCMQVIQQHYDYTPTAFSNGLEGDLIVNDAGRNEGSCKIFAFARLHKLSEAQTLACFGRYYRVDVLQHPEGTDHQNIRLFMRYGWEGINFFQEPLRPKVFPH